MENDDLSYGILNGMIGLELRKAQSLAAQTFLDLLEGRILPGHYTILVLIANNPNQSQSRIAEAAGLDRSSLVPVLKQFEKEGLINRLSARHDRRSKVMTITAKGTRLIDKYTQEIQELENRVIAGLGKDHHAQLVNLLIEFQNLLKKNHKKNQRLEP